MQDLAPYLLVVNAARSHTHIKDFYMSGRLSLHVSQGYETRKRVLEELINSKVVVLDESRLSLGILKDCSWLLKGLEEGSADAWAIVDAFPRKSRKFDPDSKLLNEIGMKGELFVLNELKRILPENTHNRIRQVSLTDDSAGFDITAPSTVNEDAQIFLEVKTSTRPGNRFNFYLSRNEFETARSTKNWYLLLVRLTDLEANLFGYLEGASLLNYFPQDTTKGFSWTSAQGSFSPDDLRSFWP